MSEIKISGKIRDLLLDHAENLVKEGMLKTAEFVVNACEAGSVSEEDLSIAIVDGAIIEKRMINIERIKTFNNALKKIMRT